MLIYLVFCRMTAKGTTHMKIAMIGQKGMPATWGGVENHVDKLSHRLAGLGHQLVVYTRPYYTSKEQVHTFNQTQQNIQLVSIPTLRSKHFDTIVHTFMATINAMWKNVDIYHFHSVGPSLLSFLPRLFRPHARVVNTFHSPDRLHAKWGWFARKILTIGEWTALKFAHKTITVSRELKEYSKEKYGVGAVYIPNGVDAAHTRKASMITAEFGLQENEYILFVARLVAHKGAHHLIRAYKQLNTKKKLVIVGDSTHTDAYVQELKELAGNDSNIIFTGFQSGPMLDELFTNAYLYVQPSESEGLSVALLEAASYGKAILASDIPANMEAISTAGFLFKNTNVEDLRNQLERLLHAESELQTAGKELRRYVLEEYNWDRIALSTSALYEMITPAGHEATLTPHKQLTSHSE